MAGTRIEVQLGINADVAAARRSIKDLENSLNKLYEAQARRGFEDFGINKAIEGAQKLEQSLNRALDVDTGKLDLSKFSSSLKQTGTSLTELNTQLLQAGSAGQQVFLSLANSISQAEVPLKKTSRLVQDFSRTLKNTVSYQLSATMFNAVTGALSDAVSYTKNLNSSLNDIRIVTGHSSDQMAKFAQQANIAAKSLSTTTNNYTKASLIFYQQGLSDAEVKKRTDAVIKMANVTKENADDVSSYMTAIWNNFDNGSKSLERYADVMTALGAATASSTKEIAAGLEKFASIGKTIGLSYEYATSAVATIVDKTRQSAETVGTGLRTIFSRLQGLSLGETLDDGVTLNKYSTALKTVGVNILDASGNMKDMDAILDSLASKWSNLSNAQKTALAQTVGGVRQYTTLISLMDNWGSMEQNLLTANSSAGALQKQQDIYAESWEAAAQRSQAALEGLYQTLLNDKGFITLIDGLTDATEALTFLADALGGLPGILSTIGMISTKVFSKQIGEGVSKTLGNLSIWQSQFGDKKHKRLTAIGSLLTGSSKSVEQLKAQREATEAQKEYQAEMRTLEQAGKKNSGAYQAASYASDLLKEKTELLNIEHQLTDTQKKNAQDQITAIGKQQQALLELRKEKELAIEQEREQASEAKKNVLNSMTRQDAGGYVYSDSELQAQILNGAYNNSLSKMRTTMARASRASTMAAKLQSYGSQIRQETDSQKQAELITQLRTKVNTAFGAGTVKDSDGLDAILEKLEKIAKTADKTKGKIRQLQQAAKNQGTKEALRQMNDEAESYGEANASRDFEYMSREDRIASQKRNLKKSLTPQKKDKKNKGKGKGKGFTEDSAEQWGNSIQTAAAAVVSLTAGVSQAQNALETLGATGATVGEQIAAGMSIATGAVTAFATGGIAGGVSYIAGALGTWAYNSYDKHYRAKEIEAEKAETAAGELENNYKSIKAEYDTLNTTVESYTNASNALDKLVTGTDEWKESLIEANEAALKLIDNLGLEDGKDYKINSDGSISFTDQGQARIEAKKSQTLNDTLAAQASANLAKANAQAARGEALKDKASKMDNKGRTGAHVAGGIVGGVGLGIGGAVAGGALAGTKIGAAIGTAIPVPVLGTIIGGVIGAIGGSLVGLIGYDLIKKAGDKQSQEDIDKLVKKHQDTGISLETLIETEDAFRNATEEYKAAVLECAQTTVAAAKEYEQASKLAAKAYLNANSTYQNLKNAEAKEDVVARSTKIYNDAALKAKKAFEDDDAIKEQAGEAYLAYLKQQNPDKDITGKGDISADGSFKYTLLENGVRTEKEVTSAQVQAYYEESQGQAALSNETIKNLTTVFSDLRTGSATFKDEDYKVSKDTQKALASFGAGRYLNVTKKEAEAFSSFDELQLTDDQKKAFGLEGKTNAEITSFFADMEAKYFETFDKAEAKIKDKFADSLIGNMTAETAQSFSNVISELEKGPFSEAGIAFGATLSEAFGKLKISSEDQTSLLSQIATIDWSQWDAFDQMKTIFEDMGYSLEATGMSWEIFEQQMRKAGGAVPDLSNLKSDLNSVASILNKMNFGEAVSEEDYKTLTKYDDAWKDLFVLQADGSRKFIGNVKNMKKAMTTLVNEQRNAIENQKKTAELEDVKVFNFDTSTDNVKNSAADFKAMLAEEENAALKALLEDKGYDNDRISTIINKAMAGETDELSKLYGLITKLIDPTQIANATVDFQEMQASLATTVDELDALQNSEAGISNEVYSKSLIALASNYEYCTSAIEEYQEALKHGLDSKEAQEAQKHLKDVVELEQKSSKIESALKNSMSNRQNLSIADLKQLREYNGDLYNSLLTSSDEDWYQASYQAYSAFLESRIALQDTDTEEYKKAVLEKQQIDEEYYNHVNDLAEKQMNNEYAKIEQQYESLVENIESATGILDEIDLDLGLDSLGQDSLEQLRQDLYEVYKDINLVNDMINNIGKQDAGSKEMAIAIADAKMMLSLKQQQAEADKLMNLDGMATVSISGVRSTIDPPYTVEGEQLTANTKEAEITIRGARAPGDTFITDDGGLNEIPPEEATYNIISDGNGIDTAVVDTSSANGPKLYDIGSKIGTYEIKDKDSCTWMDTEGNTISLPGLTDDSPEGTYVIKDNDDNLFYVTKSGDQVTVKSLSPNSTPGATTGSYTITAELKGDGKSYIIKGANGVEIATVKATDKKVGNYTVGVTATGDICLLDLKGGTPKLVDLGTIGITAEADGTTIIPTAKGFRANVDLTPMTQIVNVKYNDQDRRRIQDTLYDYSMNQSNKLAGTNNPLDKNATGQSISDLMIADAFEMAETHYNNDYIKMLRDSSSGRQLHEQGTQGLAAEVIGSAYSSTATYESQAQQMAPYIRTYWGAGYDNSHNWLDAYKLIYAFQQEYKNGVNDDTIDATSLSWEDWFKTKTAVGTDNFWLSNLSSVETYNPLNEGAEQALIDKFRTSMEETYINSGKVLSKDEKKMYQDLPEYYKNMFFTNMVNGKGSSGFLDDYLTYWSTQDQSGWDLYSALLEATMASEVYSPEELKELMISPELKSSDPKVNKTGKIFTDLDQVSMSMRGLLASLTSSQEAKSLPTLMSGFEVLFDTMSSANSTELKNNAELISASISEIWSNTDISDEQRHQFQNGLLGSIKSLISDETMFNDLSDEDFNALSWDKLFGEYLSKADANSEAFIIGQMVVKGLTAGLSANSAEAAAVAQALGFNTLAALKAAFQIHSPSRATMLMGQQLVQGLQNGLDSTTLDTSTFAGNILSALAQVTKKIEADQVWDNLIKSITPDVDTWLAGFSEEEQAEKRALLQDKYGEGFEAEGLWQNEEFKKKIAQGEKETIVTDQILRTMRADSNQYHYKIVAGKDGKGYNIQSIREGNAQVNENLYQTEEAAAKAILAMNKAEEAAISFFEGDYLTSTNWNPTQLKYMAQMIDEITNSLSVEEYINKNGLQKFYNELNRVYGQYKLSMENSVSMGWAELEEQWRSSLKTCQEIDDKAATDTYNRWKTVWEGVAALRVAAFEDSEKTVAEILGKEARNEIINREYKKDNTISFTSLVENLFKQAKDIDDTDNLLTLPSYLDSGLTTSSSYMGFKTNDYGFVDKAPGWEDFRDQYKLDLTESLKYLVNTSDVLDSPDAYGKAYDASYKDGKLLNDEDFLKAYYGVESIEKLTSDQKTKAYTLRQVSEALYASKALEKNASNQWQLKAGTDIFTGGTDEIVQNMLNLILASWDQNDYENLINKNMPVIWSNQADYLTLAATQYAQDQDARVKDLQEEQNLLEKKRNGEFLTTEEEARVSALVRQYGSLDAASAGLASEMDNCAGAVARFIQALANGYVPIGSNGQMVKASDVKQGTLGATAYETKEAAEKEAGTNLNTLVANGNNEYSYTTVTKNDADGKYYLRTDVVPADSVIDPTNASGTIPGTTTDWEKNGNKYWTSEMSRQAQAAGFNTAQEQQDYINAMVAVGGARDANKDYSDGGMLSQEEIIADHGELWANLAPEEQMEKALEIQRKYANQLKLMEEGLSELNSSGKEWIKTLKNTKAPMADQAKALSNLRKSYQKVLGLTNEQMELLDDSFFKNEKNLELIATAAEKTGKEGQEAIDQLQANTANAMLNTAAKVGKLTGEFDALTTAVSQLNFDAGDMITGTDAAYSTLNNLWTSIVDGAVNAGQSVEYGMALARSAIEALGYTPSPIELETLTLSAQGFKEYVSSHKITTAYDVDGNSFPVSDIETAVAPNDDGTYTIQVPKGANGAPASYTKSAEKPGGGGRRGGGGGRRDPRRANHTTVKPERYHEIDNHIDNLTDAYERLNKQEDRAWGKDRINAMKQVSENLKQQVQALRDKRAEAEKYLAQDKADAEKYGFNFDKTTGDVTNYKDVLLGKQAEYNAAIDAYNAMSAEQQEEMDKKYKEMKDEDGVYYSSYEDYLQKTLIDGPQDALKAYEDTMETWEQLGLDISEKLDEVYDTMVEAITYRMEFGMEITEEQLKLIEHRLKKIEDNAYKTADAIVAEGEKMGLHRKNYDLAYDQVDNLLKFHNTDWSAEDWMNGKISNEQLLAAGFTQDEIDAMKTSVETMMECVEGMTESMTASYEHMTTAFEEFNEDLERYSSAIEHAQNVTASYRNILDLTGRSATGFTAELMRSFNANTVSQAKAGLEASKVIQAQAKQQYQMALEKFQEAQTLFAEGSPEWLAAQEAFEAAEDNLNEATENFMAMWEAALQSVADAYRSNMETAIEDISKKMAGGLAGGLEALDTRYNRLKTLNDNYVDDYEKIYQLTKLTRDLETQIDNTSNVRAQKELVKFQKEINGILQSDKKLSEYDLDYLQKKYDLKLAEVALEDAQNAKSQVTMRRDSEGNYNYVYTADENAVAEAEAEYATKLYEMQKANDEYITELESSLLSLEQEMFNAMLELDPSQFASREEYMAALKEIQDFYMEQMSIYSEQLNNVISNNQSLWDNDMKWFNEHYGYKIADAKTFVTEWNETMLAQASGFATAQDFFETFETGLTEASSAAVAAYDSFRQDMDAINTTAGHPTETFAQSVTTDLNTITNAAQQASEDMDEAVKAINSAIGSIGDKITETAKIYKEKIGSMGQDTEKLALAVISLLSASGAEMTVTWTQGQAPKVQDAKEDAEQDSHKDGVTPPVALDTGGYTGSWGTEGRLALLHQKELVLNATDTSNILASVGALRQIASVIDLNALTSAGGFISLMSSGISGNKETLQQEVHIEASFPAVTDKNQIEDAFTDLVNLAAQYANRK